MPENLGCRCKTLGGLGFPFRGQGTNAGKSGGACRVAPGLTFLFISLLDYHPICANE